MVRVPEYRVYLPTRENTPEKIEYISGPKASQGAPKTVTGEEERVLLKPSEEIVMVEFIIGEYRAGKMTPASALTEISRGLIEGWRKSMVKTQRVG